MKIPAKKKPIVRKRITTIKIPKVTLAQKKIGSARLLADIERNHVKNLMKMSPQAAKKAAKEAARRYQNYTNKLAEFGEPNSRKNVNLIIKSVQIEREMNLIAGDKKAVENNDILINALKKAKEKIK